MTHLMRWIRHLGQLSCMLLTLLGNGVCYFMLCLRSPAALAAENLFLRKQLALYRERSIAPRRATLATRLTMVRLARRFDWRRAGPRPTRHVDPLASPGVSGVLVLDLPSRTSTDSYRTAGTDPSDGS